MAETLYWAWPALRGRLDTVSLGSFPTPVERLQPLEQELGTQPLYVKRDDLSSPIYGGNKVRTLEMLFALARARGARQVIATGAYGSNHALATVLHAPRVDLEPGAVLFAQPTSWTALRNLRVIVARAQIFHALPHWSLLPFGMWGARAPDRALMLPGGATPEGALGYVAAGLELARQIDSQILRAPHRIYVGVGSTCTTAGLLVGLWHAARLGVGFKTPPKVVAVRVTPWPVTSRFRILSLALQTAQHLAALTGRTELAPPWSDLSAGLEVEARDLGPGYGRASESGIQAMAMFRRLGLFELDSTYSSKAAAAFLRAARARPEEPLLFWSTKSTAPLPSVASEPPTQIAAGVRRWMLRAEREPAGAEAEH